MATTRLNLEAAGTDRAYFTHHGRPLLSFGGLSDHIFYAGDDAYDYRRWADWAADHGINHVRAYPPLSWRWVEFFVAENGGSGEGLCFPYVEVEPGGRRFDLARFDQAYWDRFRTQCEYLESRGVIVHLLMWNGWQLRAPDSRGGEASTKDWHGHFFNPANNMNDCTQGLGGELTNRFAVYHSVADGNEELAALQAAWFRKLIEVTSGLGNVYYDLVHEIAEHHDDWAKIQPWIDAMVDAITQEWMARQPDRPLILGMDTGGLSEAQREWIFTRPYFNLVIYGKVHTVEQAREWRIKYQKPYIPQESWDDDGTKYSYILPDQRIHTRKYMWKFMMAKCQQMDLYMKPRKGREQPTQYPHNYDPNGWNPFEADARVLRQFWNELRDYPNLWFDGTITEGPGTHQYVLSSPREAVLYFSSATGVEHATYEPERARVEGLALEPGEYTLDLYAPQTGGGLIDRRTQQVEGKDLEVELPQFVDDLAVHLYR